MEKLFLEVDDLVLGMDGSKVGKNVALVTEKDKGSLLIQRVARLRANDQSDIRYIYQQIFSNKFHRYVDVVNTSSGIPHISAKQIKEFKIGFPSITEQKKIASFLSSVDDKIQKLNRKKELLEEYKKGVMQKIFSQELRFKPSPLERGDGGVLNSNNTPKRKIIPYNPKLKELARQLRNNSTKSEIRLWKYLKGKQMKGYDFS